jgi:hypothetical protein
LGTDHANYFSGFLAAAARAIPELRRRGTSSAVLGGDGPSTIHVVSLGSA